MNDTYSGLPVLLPPQIFQLLRVLLLLQVLFSAADVFVCRNNNSYKSTFQGTDTSGIMMTSQPAPSQQQFPLLVIATRLHLGRAAAPPTKEFLTNSVQTFESWTRNVPNSIAVIAVDATPKFPDYDYVQAVRECTSTTAIKVLPVTPWGKFVPALNALVSYATHDLKSAHLCFVSAEVTPSMSSMERLRQELDGANGDNDVLVVGAALPGHDFFGGGTDTTTTLTTLPLTGRTCPWNTLAIWNLSKLSRTAFSAVSDHPDFAGVEECVAIAVYQILFSSPKHNSKAILLQLPDVAWEQDFSDPERKQWHEQKMKSKLDRAAKQMEALGLTEAGTVIHKKG